jgi:hypothetical protein
MAYIPGLSCFLNHLYHALVEHTAYVPTTAGRCIDEVRSSLTAPDILSQSTNTEASSFPRRQASTGRQIKIPKTMFYATACPMKLDLLSAVPRSRFDIRAVSSKNFILNPVGVSRNLPNLHSSRRQFST